MNRTFRRALVARNDHTAFADAVRQLQLETEREARLALHIHTGIKLTEKTDD